MDREIRGVQPVGMPWHQTEPVNERLKFVAAVQRGDRTMTELCADDRWYVTGFRFPDD